MTQSNPTREESMSEEKAKRVSVFAGYKLKEQGIREEDREMWTEIKDVADSNKELRTRVAELEQELKDSEMAHGYNMHDFGKLQNRLSTLEQSILDLSHPNIKNILSELNQYKSKTVNVVAFHKLEDRLSTLLKASEGMEKALENISQDNVHDLGLDGECVHAFGKLEDCGCVVREATQALADFRAVKE